MQCEQLDFNDSGGVDVADLLLCLGAFGQPTDGPGAQFAVSGGPAVAVSDLLLVLGAYGSSCSGGAEGTRKKRPITASKRDPSSRSKV